MLSTLYTPDTLAERWGCSAKHVRNLILTGELRAFQVGPRLLRVTADAVAEFEARPLLPPTQLREVRTSSASATAAKLRLQRRIEAATKR